MKPILFQPDSDNTPTYVEFTRNDTLAEQRKWIEKELESNWPGIEIVSFEITQMPNMAKLRLMHIESKQIIPLLFSTNRDERMTREIVHQVLTDQLEFHGTL